MYVKRNKPVENFFCVRGIVLEIIYLCLRLLFFTVRW